MYSKNMSASYALLGILEHQPSYGYELKRDYDHFYGKKKPLAFGQVSVLKLGSVLHGGGQPSPGADVSDWSRVVEARQRDAVENTRLSIPILYGIDAIHGHNNVRGADRVSAADRSRRDR